MNEYPAVLTLEEATKLLGIARQTAYTKAQKGEIVGQRVGNLWRFLQTALIASLVSDPHLLSPAVLGVKDGFKLEASIMNVEEVSCYLNVSPTTIYKAAQNAQIPGRKIGRDWRFSQPLIANWLCGQWEAAVEQVLFLNGQESKDQIFDVNAAASYLRVSTTTIYAAVKDGQMPGQKVGKQWRFSKSVLNHWLSGFLKKGDSRERERQFAMQHSRNGMVLIVTKESSL